MTYQLMILKTLGSFFFYIYPCKKKKSFDYAKDTLPNNVSKLFIVVTFEVMTCW